MPDESRTLEDITVVATMRRLGLAARAAARAVALAPAAVKNQALLAMAQAIRESSPAIVESNKLDVAQARDKGQTAAFLDRLVLDDRRVAAMADAVAAIAGLSDPVGRSLATWTTPNGLEFERVATPLGVVGVIFESRPNVLADAAALCLKAGNASILRGGSESFRTCSEIAKALGAGLRAAGLPLSLIHI